MQSLDDLFVLLLNYNIFFSLHQVGWKYQHVISTLEAKRKVKAAVYYKKKRADLALKAKAASQVSRSFGYLVRCSCPNLTQLCSCRLLKQEDGYAKVGLTA